MHPVLDALWFIVFARSYARFEVDDTGVWLNAHELNGGIAPNITEIYGPFYGAGGLRQRDILERGPDIRFVQSGI
jgi:hypothetical protein